MPVTQQLLSQIERMSAGRDRGQITLALVRALLICLNKINGLRLYRVQRGSDGPLTWLAVEVTRTAEHVYDDGLTIPENAESVNQQPLVKTFIETGLPDFADERILLPIVMDDGHWYGFLEVMGDALSVDELIVTGQIVAVFKHVIAMLDYGEIDTLTGLLNRKTFDEYLLNILTRVTPSRWCLGGRRLETKPASDADSHWLGIIDIDHFKRINDTYGHLIGDEVLLLLAREMKSAFRINDKLFRFGGEEFVVLLKPASPEDALAAFERFRERIAAREFPLVGKVTVSIGFVRIAATDQRTTIFDNADEALYWAKEHGRNRVASYADLIASGELTRKEDGGEIEYF